MITLNIPHLQVTLRALLMARPEEAAEVLRENGRWTTAEEFMAAGEFPERADMTPTMEECRCWVGRVLQGHLIVIHVPNQKALNALAGYFWVEPRRLP